MAAAVHPYGEWPSPMTPESTAGSAPRFGDVAIGWDSSGATIIWWSALRDGRSVVHRWVIGGSVGGADVRGSVGGPVVGAPGPSGLQGGIPSEEVRAVLSARSRVNEYGGGAIWAWGETLFWVEDHDQRIRRLDTDGSVTLLTEAPPSERAWRHCGGVVIPQPPGVPETQSVPVSQSLLEPQWMPEPQWMVVERELHVDLDGSQPAEAINELAVVSTITGESHTLFRAADFMAEPKVSPDGSALSWLQWNHPDMPWTAAELWVAELVSAHPGSAHNDSTPPELANPRRVAGGLAHGQERGLDRAVSVCGPKWSPDGVLHFCDDSEDLWRLRSIPAGSSPAIKAPAEGSGDTAPALYAGPGEVGEPRWVAGTSRYGFTPEGIILAEETDGLGTIRFLDQRTSVAAALPLEHTWIQHLDSATNPISPAGGALCAAVAGSGSELTSLFVFDPSDPEPHHLTPSEPPFERSSISLPHPIRFPSGGEELAHGLFHEPRLEGVSGPPGEAPPLLVRIHGGPTAMARSEYSGSIQFWTMAGFAVLEVNYRGSSGFGRRYRDSLNGLWGVAEVADCINAAEHLASLGRVDPRRCVIRGGSAGGFTALEAVCAEPTESGFRFAAATSAYGVTDLTSLASDTHKFEARYLDGLIGPYPEAREVYLQRSPLQHPERIASPVLILQGLEDRVVPPEQAEAIVDAMAANGIDHEYKTYEKEGHGFRLASTITDAMRREMRFYGRVLGFRPAVI